MTGWPWFEQNRRRQSGLSGPWPSVWLAKRLRVKSWNWHVTADGTRLYALSGPAWAVKLAGWLGVRAR